MTESSRPRDRLDEASLRAAVHDAYDAIAPSPEPEALTARVRRGVVRARVRRAVTATVCGLALVGATASLALLLPRNHSTTVDVPPPPLARALTCPAAPPSVGTQRQNATQRPGTATSLVPGTPVSALVCDFRTTYPTDGSGSPTSTLLSSQHLTGARFAAVLAALDVPLDPGAMSCPFIPSADELVLVFGYTSGPTVTVQVGLAGCPMVSNGVLIGIFRPDGQIPSAVSALSP
jgi:hypothetical protein